jgi:hypothetical protein
LARGQVFNQQRSSPRVLNTNSAVKTGSRHYLASVRLGRQQQAGGDWLPVQQN